MKISALIALVLPTALSAGEGQRTLHVADELTLGSLLESEINYGCGCSFHVPAKDKAEGSNILQWEDGEPAAMFIDGQLVRLKLENAVPPSGNVGEQLTITLSAPATNVRADLATSWICPKDSESCEVTEYLGTVTVTSGTKRGSLKVWGACGC